MRILHITTEKAWRGGENQLRNLALGLRERGYDVHVALQPDAKAKEPLSAVAKIFEVRMRNDIDIFAAQKIAGYCRAHEIEVIHAHTARAHSMGLLAKIFYKKPRLVVHRRVLPSKTLGIMDRWKYRHPFVDQYITVSQAIKRGLVEAGVDTNKIRTVYSAVDSKIFEGIDRAQAHADLVSLLKIAPDAVIVGCVAAMEHLKGVDVLLEAWHQVVAKGSRDIHLVYIGEGVLTEELKARVREAGLESRVSFLGFRRDAPKLMSGIDILVLPTLWEGLGTVLLDGLLAGCAVIGSDVGGVPEIIRHEETGLLVPPSDPTSLGAAILRFDGDSNLRASLSQRGAQHVRQNYSLEQMVSGCIAAYD